MNGYDIRRYEICKEKAFKLGMEIQIREEYFYISKYGKFDTVGELYHFLCGYEYGSQEKI